MSLKCSAFPVDVTCLKSRHVFQDVRHFHFGLTSNRCGSKQCSISIDIIAVICYSSPELFATEIIVKLVDCALWKSAGCTKLGCVGITQWKQCKWLTKYFTNVAGQPSFTPLQFIQFYFVAWTKLPFSLPPFFSNLPFSWLASTVYWKPCFILAKWNFGHWTRKYFLEFLSVKQAM